MIKKNRWHNPPKINEGNIQMLMKVLGINRVIASLLIRRNIDTYEKARIFFCPELSKLYDPFLMKDMQSAVKRILRAIEKNEYVLLYGDYDVDGVTSVTMMYNFLKGYIQFLRYYIPDRYQEGYGLSYKGIDFAYKHGISLIIVFDCGIKDFSQVEYAYEKGIDIIICDHHLPGETLPKAFAILDPKRSDCIYPFKELSGCGIGFKLVQAITQSMSLSIPENILDLVAISIVSDLAPIIEENRILTFYGLYILNRDRRLGLQAIKDNNLKDIDTTDILFYLGPKINVAGRLHHAKDAVKLLLSKTPEQAKERAFKINYLNQLRKAIDQKITNEALELIKTQREEHLYTTVIFKPGWNKGVLGIVASRLIEIYYRPTVVFTENHGKLLASARSINGFNLYEALEKCSAYIEKFGGHKYAAGLIISPDNFKGFKTQFEKITREIVQDIPHELKISIDYELDLSQIDSKFLRLLKRFNPFGKGNEEPVFLSRNLVNKGYAVKLGSDNSHLKMQVGKYQQKDIILQTAIGFKWGYVLEIAQGKKPFDMVYIIQENYWKNKVYTQLIIKDLRFHL